MLHVLDLAGGIAVISGRADSNVLGPSSSASQKKQYHSGCSSEYVTKRLQVEHVRYLSVQLQGGAQAIPATLSCQDPVLPIQTKRRWVRDPFVFGLQFKPRLPDGR